MIKSFAINSEGRDFVVGDIHGMFRALDYKLIEVGFNPEVDRLFSVGDLVDRGPDSIEFDRWLQKPWFHAVKGNHEQMMVDAVGEYEDTSNPNAGRLHYINGGDWLYGLPTVEQQCYAVIGDDLPLAIEVETRHGLVGIVHAECPLQDWNLFKGLFESNEHYFTQIALWSRMKISQQDDSDCAGLYKLYVGHSVVNEITELGNTVYIDTGACFRGGKLSIVQIN